MGATRGHWDDVYTARSETAVSWYQPHSVRSLEAIDAASPSHMASVIDVGGGASTLVDDLLVRGFADITVLDIAETAMERARKRLGKDADRVRWIAADITQWRPERTWDIWHDRAVFHFLTTPAQQEAYVAALTAATRPGATAIIATFALDGPEKCSGLPVQRYGPEELTARLGPSFSPVSTTREVHRTPAGAGQAFTYGVFRRR